MTSCTLAILIPKLQVTVVNPAMDKALSLLQKFANYTQNGKIPKDRLQFGAPWRHPPRTDNLLCALNELKFN